METTLSKLVIQVPDLVALIIIVLLFLKAQHRREAAINNAMKEMHEEHIESRKESRLVITKCTEVLGEVVQSMHNMNESVMRCQMVQKGK